MHLVELQSLSSILGVLTALIAPALLISASGTFILSTVTRLVRNVDQMRDFSHQLRRLDQLDADARALLESQLERTLHRVNQQQRALVLFYAAAVIFVCCSLALGMEALTQVLPNWLPVVLGLAGVIVLLAACSLLLAETRSLVAGLREEMRALARPHGQRERN